MKRFTEAEQEEVRNLKELKKKRKKEMNAMLRGKPNVFEDCDSFTAYGHALNIPGQVLISSIGQTYVYPNKQEVKFGLAFFKERENVLHLVVTDKDLMNRFQEELKDKIENQTHYVATKKSDAKYTVYTKNENELNVLIETVRKIVV
jgi:hypothetical protein